MQPRLDMKSIGKNPMETAGMMFTTFPLDNKADDLQKYKYAEYLLFGNHPTILQDKDKALTLLKQLAQNDYAPANTLLGNCCLQDIDLCTDIDLINQLKLKAFNHYKLAATAKISDPIGQIKYAECYQIGVGVDKDSKMVFELAKKAAESKHPEALLFLANCYDQGIGMRAPDLKMAFECYKQAAEIKPIVNSSAQYNLALCYQDGKGVNLDLKKAIDWYSVAIQFDNNAYALCQMSLLLSQGSDDILAKDERVAVEYLNKVANKFVQAKELLGVYYLHGSVVKKDPKKAGELFKNSYTTKDEKGDPVASQFFYLWALENGLVDNKPDLNVLLDRYEKVIKTSSDPNAEMLARINLIWWLEHGPNSIKNQARLLKYNHPTGKLNFKGPLAYLQGMRAENGYGVEKNREYAKLCYEIALSEKFIYARIALDGLNKEENELKQLNQLNQLGDSKHSPVKMKSTILPVDTHSQAKARKAWLEYENKQAKLAAQLKSEDRLHYAAPLPIPTEHKPGSSQFFELGIKDREEAASFQAIIKRLDEEDERRRLQPVPIQKPKNINPAVEHKKNVSSLSSEVKSKANVEWTAAEVAAKPKVHTGPLPRCADTSTDHLVALQLQRAQSSSAKQRALVRGDMDQGYCVPWPYDTGMAKALAASIVDDQLKAVLELSMQEAAHTAVNKPDEASDELELAIALSLSI